MRKSTRLFFISSLLAALSLLASPLAISARLLPPAAVDLSDQPALEFSSPTGFSQAGLEIEPLARLKNSIYYLKPCSPSKWSQAELYRANINGSDAVKILSAPLGPVRDMQFVKGWIYYKAANGSLRRIRCDGTEDMELAARASQYEVRGSYVFYVWVDGLYRFDTASKNCLRLDGGFDDYYISRIDRIEGDWIYYQRVTSQRNDPQDLSQHIYTYGLYRIKMDGSQRTALIEEDLRSNAQENAYPHPICLAFSGNNIYFTASGRGDGAIFVIGKDGTGRHLLCNNTADSSSFITDIYVNNSWLYYRCYLSSVKSRVNVFKIKTDGTGWTWLPANIKKEIYPDDYQLARALANETNVNGQWVYYNTRHEIYRVKVDGSSKAQIYNAGDHDICWMELRGDYLFFTWVETSSTWELKEWRCRVRVDGSGFTMLESS